MSISTAEPTSHRNDPTVQHSPLYHERTCGIIPICGRTIIRRHQPKAAIGSIFLPEELQGKYQGDWQAEVVANSTSGGWRMGDMWEAAERKYGHMTEWPPDRIPKHIRKDRKIWKVAPYYVAAPVIPVGTRIICCWAAGQPFSSSNGYDYFLADGEYCYKAVITR